MQPLFHVGDAQISPFPFETGQLSDRSLKLEARFGSQAPPPLNLHP